MSRPPSVKQQTVNSVFNPPVIDFVNKGYQVGAPYYDAYQPSIYAQAGYPGYAMSTRLCTEADAYAPAAYPPPYPGVGYPAYSQYTESRYSDLLLLPPAEGSSPEHAVLGAPRMLLNARVNKKFI